MRLLTRLRVTALPTLRLTAKAKRLVGSSFGSLLNANHWFVYMYIAFGFLAIMAWSYQFFYIEEEAFWLFEFLSMLGIGLLFTTLAGLYVYFRYDQRAGVALIAAVPIGWYVYSAYVAETGVWNDIMFQYGHVILAMALIPGLVYLASRYQSRKPADTGL